MPSPDPHPLAAPHGALLLGIARESIRHGAAEGAPLAVDLAALPAALAEVRATFVTLKLGGGLRGCMGQLKATRAMAVDVADNAFAAAFLDWRFNPVRAGEVDRLDISLSLLSRPEPIEFVSEADLIARLVPGLDGVILEKGSRRGTFLPDMWEMLPGPAAFLAELKIKAGLEPGETAGKAYRYRTQKIPA
jgi:AmmeMemoRadiSam system protein A